MAEDKKSFLLYADIIHTVRKMPKDKAGELFLTILSYVNDENPVPQDMVVDLVFEPIKQQLKRDLKRWEEFRKKQSVNGAKGGRPKKEEGIVANEQNPENPGLLKIPKQSLNANANANVNVKEASSIDVFEVMRRQLLPSQFSNDLLKEEAIKFVKRYKGENIHKIGALINSWVSNIKPDIQPKKFVN